MRFLTLRRGTRGDDAIESLGRHGRARELLARGVLASRPRGEHNELPASTLAAAVAIVLFRLWCLAVSSLELTVGMWAWAGQMRSRQYAACLSWVVAANRLPAPVWPAFLQPAD
jgi:hypothetical protein